MRRPLVLDPHGFVKTQVGGLAEYHTVGSSGLP
jgi:hypothetical protein